jgi:NifU-like protein involved in Fe-S cluster formation
MGHLKHDRPEGDIHHRDHEERQGIFFSAKVIEHALRPQHMARMDQPDAYGDACGWCGEVMEMFLRLDGETITEATFWANGCISTMACADMLTTLVQGLTLEQAERISPDDLAAALDGLPYASVHCSELAVATLAKTIAGRRQKAN